jgi:predicted polyphosphate/ATP-dependent NAD kinase
MGGRIGLKGTDGVYEKAVEMGADPVAPKRAVEFLVKLKALRRGRKLRLIACPALMGKAEVDEAGLEAEVLPMKTDTKTTAKDTKNAVRLMAERGVDLVLFVGGDGTARDILDALSDPNSTPVLGIPSGVKMYSGIFAVNTADAAYIVEAFLRQETQFVDYEIVDADEEDVRKDRLHIRLYGYLKGPFLPMRIQGSKQVSQETVNEYENQMAVARSFVEEMDREAIYILGPGTTVRCVGELLGIKKTLLGVDIYRDSSVINDVNEERILSEIGDWRATWIVVSPIGRQGMLFGRGNQQISPTVIKLVGREKIIVLATKSKIQGIRERVLRVDTGDKEVDDMLAGYLRVATDYREWRVMKVE